LLDHYRPGIGEKRDPARIGIARDENFTGFDGGFGGVEHDPGDAGDAARRTPEAGALIAGLRDGFSRDDGPGRRERAAGLETVRHRGVALGAVAAGLDEGGEVAGHGPAFD